MYGRNELDRITQILLEVELAFGHDYRRLMEDTDVGLGLQSCYNRFNT
jgi:hypothetical protein